VVDISHMLHVNHIPLSASHNVGKNDAAERHRNNRYRMRTPIFSL
jgi:hypothetical protein